MAQSQLEFALQFEQVRTLLIDVRSFGLEDLVQALGLQRRTSHGEVDESDARTNVGREFDRRISRRQKDGERRRQVDVLVAQRNENSTTGTAQFAVQHGIENRVVVLDVLHQQRIAET